MKKLLAMLLVAATLLTFSATFAEEENYEGRMVTVAIASTELNDAYQAEIDAFCAKYGCKADVEILSSDPDEANNTLYLRAATGNLPDVFKTSIGALANNLDPANNLVELTDYDFMNNVADAFIAAASDSEGRVYATPTNTANVAGVFYNKNVFADLGLEIPETWADFLSVCQWIKENTDMVPVCNPYDGAAGKQITYLAQYFYINAENPEFAAQYTAQEIDLHESPALMRGLQKVYDMFEQDIQNEDPLSTSLEDAALALCEGTAAFVICRTNIMTNVETVAPESYNDIGFFPLPDENAETRGVAVWMPQGWHVSKTSEDLELALKLVEFLTTSEATDAYCSACIPTGAFMLKGIELPDNVSEAVKEAQDWVSKSSTPVMEYVCAIKGANLPNILAMCGTGELTPDEAVEQIEADFRLNAEQNGIW